VWNFSTRLYFATLEGRPGAKEGKSSFMTNLVYGRVMVKLKKVIAFLVSIIVILLIFIALNIRPNIININMQQNDGITYTELERYQEILQHNYTNSIESINTKFNVIISIIGIAVSVWVGINIYNLVDRVQLDNLKKEQEE